MLGGAAVVKPGSRPLPHPLLNATPMAKHMGMLARRARYLSGQLALPPAPRDPSAPSDAWRSMAEAELEAIRWALGVLSQVTGLESEHIPQGNQGRR